MLKENREKLAPHYEAITAEAEDRIRSIMSGRVQHRGLAWGIYLLWYELTAGYQNDADAERLESIIDGSGESR